ncbi:MAG: caspase family protein, partial [Candidatus Accumulibacter sp.]
RRLRQRRERLAAELAERGFTIRKLLDAEATQAAMVSGIESLIASAISGDVVVTTYPGHGTDVPDTHGDEFDGLDERRSVRTICRPVAARSWTTKSTACSAHARKTSGWC